MLLAAAGVLAQTAEQTESVEPLRAGSIFLILGIILVICFALVIAGLGYFSPNSDD
jgi:hypothetical protein